MTSWFTTAQGLWIMISVLKSNYYVVYTTRIHFPHVDSHFISYFIVLLFIGLTAPIPYYHFHHLLLFTCATQLAH